VHGHIQCHLHAGRFGSAIVEGSEDKGLIDLSDRVRIAQFIGAAAFPTSMNSLCAWVVRRVGPRTGPGGLP
jgi:hypothetical protein